MENWRDEWRISSQGRDGMEKGVKPCGPSMRTQNCLKITLWYWENHFVSAGRDICGTSRGWKYNIEGEKVFFKKENSFTSVAPTKSASCWLSLYGRVNALPVPASFWVVFSRFRLLSLSSSSSSSSLYLSD